MLNSKSILEYSKGSIERAGHVVIARVSCLLSFLQHLPLLTADIFWNISDISINNEKLVSYLLNEVRINPQLHTVDITSPHGEMVIRAIDVKISQHTFFVGNPSKPLPPEVVYALRVVDSIKHTDTWYYKDKNLNTVASEVIPNTSYYPPQRPWFLEATQKKTGIWTKVYQYNPTNEFEIAYALPFYNAKGDLVAVVQATTSITLLSEFFAQQQAGSIGNVFLMDKSGELIIPIKNSPESKKYTIPDDAAYAAYAQFLKTPEPGFVTTSKEIKYLASIHAFPENQEWLIVMIVPFRELFLNLITTQKKIILFSLICLILSALISIYFSKRISHPIVKLSKELDEITHLNFESKVRVFSHIREISLIDISIASMKSALRSFERYVPKKIVRQLIQQGKAAILGGEKKELTILFSDIVGSTTIAESLPTDAFIPLLSEYLNDLSQIILQNQGTIDKYIGDCIMAFWGAPEDVPDHAVYACTAALCCQAQLLVLNKKRREKNQPEFLTRFGIHSGEVFVGNIGTPDRMNYTIIGDAANFADQLQIINKHYRTYMIISKEVRNKIGNKFLTRPLDIIFTEEQTEQTTLYELVAKFEGPSEIQPKPEASELCTVFTQGFEAFFSNDLEKAKTIFEALQLKFPHDYPTQMYLQRLLIGKQP